MLPRAVERPVHPVAGRADAEALDAADPLASFRERFVIPDPDLVYFDGNSLGRPATATLERLEAATRTWAEALVEGWEEWIDLPARVGDLIGREIVGAGPGQVLLADSTTVNLYKLASAAMDRQRPRRVVLTDAANFPTDRYVLEGVARAAGGEVRSLQADRVEGPTRELVASELGPEVALVALSHVGYRSGAVADVEGITADAHAAGALVLWDLCHSAGAVPVELDRWGVDLAAGCTYKYLNAGPGAPAFLHVRRELRPELSQPVWGWFGQRDQFAMGPRYDPEPGITGFLSGTPNVLGAIAVESAVEVVAEAGIERIRAKGMALTELAVRLFEGWLVPLGFVLDSPAKAERRGSHVSLRHPDARLICRALRERARVVPDFRAPDAIRVGPSPLYTRFADVWDGLDRLREVTQTGIHRNLDVREPRVT